MLPPHCFLWQNPPTELLPDRSICCAASISAKVSAAFPKLQQNVAPPALPGKLGFTPLTYRAARFQEPFFSLKFLKHKVRKGQALGERSHRAGTWGLWGPCGFSGRSEVLGGFSWGQLRGGPWGPVLGTALAAQPWLMGGNN